MNIIKPKTAMKKGAVFTDIHWGKKANSVTHNQDCTNYVDWFCKKVRSDPSINYIAFLGDWNENRSALNIATLKASYYGAKKLNELGLPIYFVVGNHDLYYRNSREIHSVVPFNEFSNFVVIDELTRVGDVLFCPYLFHDEYPMLKKHLDVPIWMGHFEFRGFVVTGYSITMPTGPDANDYVGPKYIISGHFHKRQAHNQVVYIGNTFPMDFGDAGDGERGMMIYDHVNDEMIFENWDDCPRYIKTTLSEILETSTNKEKILVPNARVKCIVDIPITFEESTYLHQKFLDNYNLREFSMEEAPEIRTALTETETEIDWDITELTNVNDLVLRMLNDIESEHIDNELLIKLYQETKKSNQKIPQK